MTRVRTVPNTPEYRGAPAVPSDVGTGQVVNELEMHPYSVTDQALGERLETERIYAYSMSARVIRLPEGPADTQRILISAVPGVTNDVDLAVMHFYTAEEEATGRGSIEVRHNGTGTGKSGEMALWAPAFGHGEPRIYLNTKAADGTGKNLVTVEGDEVQIDAYTAHGEGAPAEKKKRLTGVLDANGEGAIAHGISNLNRRVLDCAAWYRGNTNESTRLDNWAVDHVYVYVRGGQAGRQVRVYVTYEDVVSGW